MTLKQLVKNATDKSQFKDLQSYIKFCLDYLNYVSDNLQAVIVSQNENHYCFYQYDKTANFQISRPINTNLMYKSDEFEKISKEYLKILKSLKKSKTSSVSVREIINIERIFKNFKITQKIQNIKCISKGNNK